VGHSGKGLHVSDHVMKIHGCDHEGARSENRGGQSVSVRENESHRLRDHD
jgi:hypothetical protein